jgi:hypothetical protein
VRCKTKRGEIPLPYPLKTSSYVPEPITSTGNSPRLVLRNEAKPGQILTSPHVVMAVEDAVTVEPVGEFALNGIRRPLAACNVLATASPHQLWTAFKNDAQIVSWH